MHREKPHKLLQVGVTPTPATILRSEPTASQVRAKDAVHSPLAKEGSKLRMAGQSDSFKGSGPAARL